jgi:hypothetical protein
MMPYMLIVIVCMVIMYLWPGMTLWLPLYLYGAWQLPTFRRTRPNLIVLVELRLIGRALQCSVAIRQQICNAVLVRNFFHFIKGDADVFANVSSGSWQVGQ